MQRDDDEIKRLLASVLAYLRSASDEQKRMRAQMMAIESRVSELEAQNAVISELLSSSIPGKSISGIHGTIKEEDEIKFKDQFDTSRSTDLAVAAADSDSLDATSSINNDAIASRKRRAIIDSHIRSVFVSLVIFAISWALIVYIMPEAALIPQVGVKTAAFLAALATALLYIPIQKVIMVIVTAENTCDICRSAFTIQQQRDDDWNLVGEFDRSEQMQSRDRNNNLIYVTHYWTEQRWNVTSYYACDACHGNFIRKRIETKKINDRRQESYKLT